MSKSQVTQDAKKGAVSIGQEFRFKQMIHLLSCHRLAVIRCISPSMVRVDAALLNPIEDVNRGFKSMYIAVRRLAPHVSPSLPTLAQAPSASLITC